MKQKYVMLFCQLIIFQFPVSYCFEKTELKITYSEWQPATDIDLYLQSLSLSKASRKH